MLTFATCCSGPSPGPSLRYLVLAGAVALSLLFTVVLVAIMCYWHHHKVKWKSTEPLYSCLSLVLSVTHCNLKFVDLIAWYSNFLNKRLDTANLRLTHYSSQKNNAYITGAERADSTRLSWRGVHLRPVRGAVNGSPHTHQGHHWAHLQWLRLR